MNINDLKKQLSKIKKLKEINNYENYSLQDLQKLPKFNGIMIHGGGWKKLHEIKIDNQLFMNETFDTIGIKNVTANENFFAGHFAFQLLPTGSPLMKLGQF